MSSVPGSPGLVPPAYGDRSLADVVPSVARALGVALDGHPAGFELPPAPTEVLFGTLSVTGGIADAYAALKAAAGLN